MDHVFCTKRAILPLLLSFIFTIGAIIASYRSIFTLDAAIEEHEHAEKKFAATISFDEGKRVVGLQKGELRQVKGQRTSKASLELM